MQFGRSNLSAKTIGCVCKRKWSIEELTTNCVLYLSRRRHRRQLSAGGGSASSLIQTRAPLIPERDYQGSLPPQPGSTGYSDQGQHGSWNGISRRSSQNSVTFPGHQ